MKALTLRFRWITTVLAVLALTVGVSTATVAVTPSPALALPCAGYIPVVLPNGQVRWICIPIWVEVDLCPGCPDHAFELDHAVQPADEWWVEGLTNGLGLLDRAAHVGPREAAGLRAQAQDAFFAAARGLGVGNRVRLGQAGALDWETGVIRPDPDPWLVAAGTDVADGLNAMLQALAGPFPDPWLERAMAEFEEARVELALREPIGR